MKLNRNHLDFGLSTGLAGWVVYGHPALRNSGHCLALLVGFNVVFRYGLMFLRSQVLKRLTKGVA